MKLVWLKYFYSSWKYQCIAGIFVLLIMMTQWTYSSNLWATSLSLQIYNSYSGTLQANTSTGTRYQDINNIYRTNKYISQLLLWANNTSSYLLSGNFTNSPITGNGVGVYNHTRNITLTPWVINHTISITYLKGYEPFTPKPITIGIDQLAPSQSQLLIPNNILFTGDGFNLARSPSIDTGAWLSTYTILIGLTPALSSMSAIMTSNTSQHFSSNSIPQGTIYRAVIAIDQVWNQSTSMIGYFHHQVATQISSNTQTISNWWAWGSASSRSIYHWSWSKNLVGLYKNNSNKTNSINDRNTSVPVFTIDNNGNTEFHAIAQCRRLEIRNYKYCVQWDNFSSIWKVAWDDGSQRLWYRVSQWTRDNFVPNFDYQKVIIDGEIPQSFDPLLQIMYDRYYESAPAWRVLPMPGLVITDIIPDAHLYEQVLQSYWVNYTSMTRINTQYIIALSVLLISLTVWFFAWWYHHRYKIYFR